MNLKLSFPFVALIAVVSMSLSSCGTSPTEEIKSDKKAVIPAPEFTVGVKALSNSPQNGFPYLQSFAWARSGDEVLLIGGRTIGFHGRTLADSAFKSGGANTSVWVINLKNFQFYQAPLNFSNPLALQLSSSNMNFCTVGDGLYLCGGFGLKNASDKLGNYTYNRIVAVSISEMINAVKTGGDPLSAVKDSVSSPFLQVTGGELITENGWFYLMFGQNFSTVYGPGTTGNYSSAIRQFKFAAGVLTDTVSYIDTVFHRRDLTVVPVLQQEGNFYTAFGGVFDKNDNGYLNPVNIGVDPGVSYACDVSTVQKTNQYLCGTACIYDPYSDANYTVLLGGIGQYQYHEDTGTWENGDQGSKLPFVKTITQMIFQQGSLVQKIQLPPVDPELPALIGANAVFFPDQNLLFQTYNAVDYGLLTNDSMRIGLLYGGITSMKPTSSSLYPTSINNTVYEVYVKKSNQKKLK
jgi:hypothetical protein